MTDRYLLEAMREVDDLTPACPPIAPQPVVLTHEEVMLCRKTGLTMARYAELKQASLDLVNAAEAMTKRGVSHNSGLALKLEQAQLMQNAANRSMTPEELARYNRGMQNAARPTETLGSDGRPIGRT